MDSSFDSENAEHTIDVNENEKPKEIETELPIENSNTKEMDVIPVDNVQTMKTDLDNNSHAIKTPETAHSKVEEKYSSYSNPYKKKKKKGHKK